MFHLIQPDKYKPLVLGILILFMLSSTGQAVAARHSVLSASSRFSLDLDVTYIQRTPRYPRFLSCASGQPLVDYPCPSPQKTSPELNEPVTFTAHVTNKGVNPASQFDYAWYVDDVLFKQGTHIWIDAEQVESLEWAWQPGAHRVKFVISGPGDDFAPNNSQEVRTDAYALSIFVEQGQYDAFEQRVNLIGSLSFEDWIQAQFDQLNAAFINTQYATTPNGVPNRVRIDKIVVAPEMDGATANAMRLDPDEFLNDGRWLFSDGDPTNAHGYYGDAQNPPSYDSYAGSNATAIDWALLHELGHQLGRFDMYNIDFDPNHNLITGPNGLPLKIGHLAHYGFGRDMMEDPGSGLWSEYHAASLLRDDGDRRGLYGEYIYDVPAQNTLRIVNGNGQPAVGAAVSVYRDQYESLQDSSLYLRGTTDAAGELNLGANPFGPLDHNAVNATLFISTTLGSSTEYHWLEVTAFNLAFWRGHQDQATYTLMLGKPDNSDLTLPDVLEPDTSPPTVTLDAPVNSITLSGLVNLSASASDNRGIKRVEILADGHTIAVFPRPPYAVQWNTAQLVNGSHELWARAYDTALPANITESAHVQVNILNGERDLFSWDFNRDNDFEGWEVGWKDISPPLVVNGSLRLIPPTGDLGIKRWLPFGLTTQSNQVISVRMRIASGGEGTGTVYWTTYADQGEDERKATYFNLVGDNVWRTYNIPIGTHPLWVNRIRTLRIDPVNGNQYIGAAVEVDWIRICGDPQDAFPLKLFLPLLRR